MSEYAIQAVFLLCGKRDKPSVITLQWNVVSRSTVLILSFEIPVSLC